ncbi:hypothetical protein [Salinibacter altiplanensis]|uniref:hypothetical protein n=1 Tax=Salinibacter altiplanensis TaxID=1803181 RepID=UPI000C9F76DF|nr:hypothetical protein [Salinibacter altiplanensis]
MSNEPPAPAIDPPQKPLDAMHTPEDLDRSFEGWSEDVFRMLDRLRAEPHIDQYKAEKPGVTEFLKDPFRRYRDDLVVNWVLPNRLGFETEKYVFSRLLKNDFGAGGCNDNLWMSFYRPETRRLEDVQITHRVSPDGFAVGIYVGAHATDLLTQATSRIHDAPGMYLDLVNPLLQNKNWRFHTHGRAGGSKTKTVFDAPLDQVPDSVEGADGIHVRHYIGREETLHLGAELVDRALDLVLDVWPIYRFYLAEGMGRGSPAEK